MSGTHLIRIVSLAYNLFKKNENEVTLTEGEISVILTRGGCNRLGCDKKGIPQLTLYLEEEFGWSSLRINHLELLDIYEMDDASIVLILSKKALNYNLIGESLGQDELLYYSKVIDLLTDELANS